MKLYAELRMFADSYQQAQKLRMEMDSRFRAVSQGVDEADAAIAEKWQGWANTASLLEKAIETEMRGAMELHPAWPFLDRVKGMGLILGAQLVGLIGDIGDFDTISKLWRFAGKGRGLYYISEETGRAVLPVVGKVWSKKGDGKRRLIEVRPEQPEGTKVGEHRDVPIAGFTLNYSKRLKKLMWVIAGSFNRCNSPYRAIYLESKAYYEAERDWTKLHIHYAALTRMEKLFLSHLWVEWRKAVGLPVSVPYILGPGGHTTDRSVEDFLEPCEPKQG